MNGAEALMCQMLSCGSLDLKLLDDVEYGWDDVLDQMDYPYGGMTFNDLMRAVFDVGFINIEYAVQERIEELESGKKHGWLDKDELFELECLHRLNPANDFSTYCNCIDTHVYCEQNGGLDQQYMQEALDSFERNTGFCISFI